MKRRYFVMERYVKEFASAKIKETKLNNLIQENRAIVL